MTSQMKIRWFGVLVALVGLTLAPMAMGQADAVDLCKFDATIMKGPIPPPAVSAAWPYYYPWKALGPGDQGIVRPCPVCPGQHSGLVGWNANIDDELFSQYVLVSVASGPYGNIPLVFMFGECYGGGMIDDLVRTGLPNPMSMVSASFFNQTASYPIKNGNGFDFVWAYTQALTIPNLTALGAAVQAGRNSPFGWFTNPSPARKGETRGSETAEYYSQNFGDNVVLVAPYAKGEAKVILWAGRPKQQDDLELANIYFLLLQAGYAKENIVALFGSGMPKNSALASIIQAVWNPNNPKGMNGATHLRAATEKQLDIAMRNWAFPAGPKQSATSSSTLWPSITDVTTPSKRPPAVEREAPTSRTVATLEKETETARFIHESGCLGPLRSGDCWRRGSYCGEAAPRTKH